MKRSLLLHIVLALVLSACGQTSSSNQSAVRLMAEPDELAPSITLRWQFLTGASGFSVYRRAVGATAWSTSLATLPGAALQFADTTVEVGVAYEYKVVRSGNGTGYGYVRSGIAVPPVDARGKLILLVEAEAAAALETELEQLVADLNGDGWIVVRHDVLAENSPANTRALLVEDYNADPTNVKALYILGHVPVPYSGNHAPDGHSYHAGAWACDGYYAEMNGTWTDNTVNAEGSNYAWNHNVPGDGKFDQSDLPTAVELQVGRVDLSRLDVMVSDEASLLSAYLSRAHAWKTAQFSVPATAVVWDNLEWVGNPLAASGFMSASPCVGIDAVTQLDPTQAPFSQHYLAYDDLITFHGSTGMQGTGPGGTTFPGTENGLNCDELVNNVHGGVFNLSIGSYYGDWDNTNNFLRGVLAKGNGLAHMWSGMPNWFLHPLAMGEPLGYCAMRTMNNSNSDYSLQNGGWQGQSMGQAHMALMGNSSLRMRYIAPPSGLLATNQQWFARFDWSPSPQEVDGYHIYRIDDDNGVITRITTQAVQDTFYTSSVQFVPGHRYMVRAMDLVTTPSGSFYDLSLGALAIAQGELIADCAGVIGGSAIPGTACDDGDPLTFWEVYDTLCACAGSPIGMAEYGVHGLKAWPSPANDELWVSAASPDGEVVITSSTGVSVLRQRMATDRLKVDTRSFAAGSYTLTYLPRKGSTPPAQLRFVVAH